VTLLFPFAKTCIRSKLSKCLDISTFLSDDISRMILADFITRQDDRHLSNMAIKMNDVGESIYPLYDNGRSLFY